MTSFVAYVANNNSNDLLVTEFFTSGDTWQNSTPVGTQSSKTAPALAVISEGQATTLVMAYVANNSSNDLLVTASRDGGSTWTTSFRVGTLSSKTAPALAVIAEGLVNTLVLAYVANNETNDLLVTKSSDIGTTWSAPVPVSTQSSKTAPALAVLDNTLFLAYVAGNATNELLVTKSGDMGNTWTASSLVGGQSSQTAPALAVADNRLVLAYVANNSTNNLLATASSDGGNTWLPSAIVNQQSSKTAPALAAVPGAGGGLMLVYVANNDTNDLLTAVGLGPPDGWSFSSPIAGQSSRTAPAIVIFF